MSKYCVLKAPRSRFLVKETKTSFILKVYSTLKDAEKLTSYLNKGGGFGGETPFFFLKRNEQHNAA